MLKVKYFFMGSPFGRKVIDGVMSAFIAATLILAAVTYILIATDFFSLPWFYQLEKPERLSALGTLGDFVGGLLNPLFALLAFLWLKKSVAMQKEELSGTRYLLNSQRFETTFFNLMNSFHSAEKNSKAIDGFSFEWFASSAMDKESFESGLHFARSNFHRVELYIRQLYLILRLIASRYDCGYEILSKKEINFLIMNEISPDNDEMMYAEIVKSSISSSDAWVILIFCLAAIEDKDGASRMRFDCLKYLIERYAILESIEFVAKPQAVEFIASFAQSAFGSNSIISALSERS